MDKRTKRIFLAIAVIITLAFAYPMTKPDVRQNYRFLWTSSYFFLVYIAMIAGFVFIFIKKLLPKMMPLLRYPAFLVFMPFAFFPVIRCYFKVPYLFCSVCPKKCPWGELRRFIVPAFLIQNVDKRFWCYRFCPFGTIQDLQSASVSKKIRLPGWLRWIRYIFLAFAAAAVYFTPIYAKKGFFFIGTYSLVAGVLILALVLFVLAFFIPRVWCNYFCPIGTVGDLVLKLEKTFSNIAKKTKGLNDSK